jgi:hypothetical protein
MGYVTTMILGLLELLSIYVLQSASLKFLKRWAAMLLGQAITLLPLNL